MTLDTLKSLPGGCGFYKVVQIKIDGKAYLYFAGVGNLLRDILKEILDQYGLKYMTWRLRHGRGPDSSGDRYYVYGMGKAAVNGNKIKFYGESLDYNIPIHKEFLNEIQQLNPKWEISFGETDPT